MLCPERWSFRGPAFAGILEHQGGLFIVVSKPRVSRTAGTVGGGKRTAFASVARSAGPRHRGADTPGLQSVQRNKRAGGAKYFEKSCTPSAPTSLKASRDQRGIRRFCAVTGLCFVLCPERWSFRVPACSRHSRASGRFVLHVLDFQARPACLAAFLIGNGSFRGKNLRVTGRDIDGRDIGKERTGRINKPPCPFDDVC